MISTFNRLVLCPTLIGRALYLTTFQQRLEATASGHRQISLLSGEAGIGKSRLATEIKIAAASQGFLILEGYCFPSDTVTPYAPILDLLRVHFIHNPTWSAQIQENGTFRLLHQLLPGIAPLVAEETPSLHLEPEVYKQRLFTALIAFFASFTAEQPLLLLLEDLHWSDEASLDFLLYLVRGSAKKRLFLLLTYRTNENNPALQRWLAQIDRERIAQEFPLTPLTLDDVADMVRAIFGQPLRADALEVVYRLTEGNPFFVEEVLKSLLASGDLVYSPKGWDYPTQQRSLQVPRSVQAALRQRTAALNQTSQQVLNTASVVGRRFSFSLLQAMTGLDEPALLVSIKQLIAAQLVTQESVEYFAFRHALTWEAVYSALLARERKSLHRTAAESIERIADGSTSSYRDELAYHYGEGEVWDKTLVYARQAGEEAHRMYVPRAAIEHFTRALNAASHLGLSAASLYRLRGLDYQILGAFDMAKTDHENALQIARTQGNYHTEWQALIDLGSLWAERDYAQTKRYYQQALDLAQAAEDSSIIPQSLNRLGNWHVNAEQPLEALQYHHQALALFQEEEDVHGIAETYDLLGLDCYLQGDLYHGARYFGQAVTGFRQIDDRVGLASCLANQVIAASISECDMVAAVPQINMSEALAWGEEALQIARETDQHSAEAYALLTLATCFGAHGDYARAFTLGQEGLQIAESIEHYQWMAFGHWTLGKVYLNALIAIPAQQHFEQALLLAQKIGSRYWLHTTTGLLARVYTLQNDFVRAEALLNMPDVVHVPPQTYGQRLICGARLHLALAQGKYDQAQLLVKQLVETVRDVPSERLPPSLLLIYGETLLYTHREAEAESILQTALNLSQKLDLRPLLWRVHLSLGKLFLARHRDEDARQALITAQEIAQELAINLPDDALQEQFFTALARQFPHNPSLTPRRAAKLAFGGLTEREREVALLIAEGMANPDIAQHLVIGKRTVEAHVSSILSKLGLTSRVQIALWVREKKPAN